MQHTTFSSPWIPVCDLSQGNSNLGNQEQWRPCRLGPEGDAQMIHLCWCLCFHRSPWLEEMGQGKAREAAQREPRSGMVHLMLLPVLKVSQPGASPFIGREGRMRAGMGNQHPLSFPFVCLSAFLLSFHQPVPPRETAVEVFLTQMCLAWVTAAPCLMSLGFSFGKLELLIVRLAFLAFRMVAWGDRWRGLSLFVNVKQGAGRPRVRVQGQVDVLCLLPSCKLSRLPSSPQRDFQPQMSLRPDKVVTALLQGGWMCGRAERGFAGMFL